MIYQRICIINKGENIISALGPQGKKAKNLLHRRFDTHLPFLKMVTDVSEFRYGNKTQEERSLSFTYQRSMYR